MCIEVVIKAACTNDMSFSWQFKYKNFNCVKVPKQNAVLMSVDRSDDVVNV